MSVIIPTKDEESQIGACLASLQASAVVDEIIVVAAGDRTKTVAIAKEVGARVIESETASRANQMNCGVEVASGDLLLFLHADTIVPERALRAMVRTMEKHPESPGGGFLRFFDRRSLYLKVTCLFALWRCHFEGVFYGDQAIFVRADAMEKVGGYNESIEQAEEIELCLKLKKLGKMRIVLSPILSSARRFEKRGVREQTMLDKKKGRELIDEYSRMVAESK